MNRTVLSRINSILTSREKRKGIVLVLLLSLSSLLDVFGMAAFLPMLLVILNRGDLSENSVIAGMYEGLGFESEVSFGIALTLAAFLVVIIKTKIVISITRKKASFAYEIARTRALDAVERFMNLSYPSFSKADFSAELNRVTNTPLIFANNIIIPAGTIYSEGLISAILILVVLLTSPWLIIAMSVLALPAFILYKMQRKSIRRSSEEIRNAYPDLIRNSMQAIHSFTEIRSFNKEEFFRSRIERSYSRISRIFAADHTRNAGIGRITEVVAALVISSFVLYILIFVKDRNHAIILLSVYAGISFRAIPSVNRIFSAVVQIRSNEFSIDDIEQVASPGFQKSVSVTGSLSFNSQIELREVSYAHDSASVPVVNQLSAIIQKGERILITGNSGAGKTTLLQLLMRFIEPQEGAILVDNKVSPPEEVVLFRKLVGYVPQDPVILNTSILENIAFGIEKESIDITKVHQIVEDLQLKDWIDTLDSKLDTYIGEKGARISGGQRQRIALARALYHDAEIFILDETTNQIQPEMEEDIWKLFHQICLTGKTLIAVSHQTSSRKYFDAVYVFEDGKLIRERVPVEPSVSNR